MGPYRKWWFLHNSKGFTLVEMLVVLFIWSVFIGIMITLSPSLFHKQKEEAFMEQFQADVLWVQQQTMTTRTHYSIIFLPEEKTYRILKNRFFIVETRTLPNDWEVSFSYTSLDRHIRFDVSGSILESGSIQFLTPTKKFKVVFPVGKARYYVLEQ
ncbi:hypothetical protein N783_15410 [Pontibacillus marinus BH030004 = DSM 16465]|uniref:Competence protein ComG n=2 Tax=Pontibacillus TaxID=289201 RepID=A0A0A5G1U6_9BACI|nr:hypothetical protein N783_15410 [Pontibacillus marinus BH030004 = DSM 16465]